MATQIITSNTRTIISSELSPPSGEMPKYFSMKFTWLHSRRDVLDQKQAARRAGTYISSKGVDNKSSLIHWSDFLPPAAEPFPALVRRCSSPLLKLNAAKPC